MKKFPLLFQTFHRINDIAIPVQGNGKQTNKNDRREGVRKQC